MKSEDWSNLARETARWMNKEGYKHDYDAHTRAYCTRADWVEAFGHLYDIDENSWITCVQHMFRIGHTVGFEIGKGFFLCSPSDSATYVTRLINLTSSLMDRVHELVKAMEAGGNWPEISNGFAGRVRIRDVRQLTGAMEDLGVIVDEEVRVALEDAQRLITSRHRR